MIDKVIDSSRDLEQSMHAKRFNLFNPFDALLAITTVTTLDFDMYQELKGRNM